MKLFDTLLGIFSPQHRKMLETRRKAREELDSLLSRGLVEKVLMFPAEFGGTDDPRNRTYLPTTLVQQKRDFDADVMQRIKNGEELRYAVTPEYDSDSFVPARVDMEAVGGDTALKQVIDVAQHRTWESERRAIDAPRRE